MRRLATVLFSLAMISACGREEDAAASLVPQATSKPMDSWMPSQEEADIMWSLRGQLAKSSEPPFHRFDYQVYWVGRKSFNDDVASGCVAYLDTEDKDLVSFNPDIGSFTLLPRSTGDLGDLYYRVTGERHPKLGGPTTEIYKRSLQEARLHVDEAFLAFDKHRRRGR